MKPQLSIEIITPQIAEQWLTKNIHNRPLSTHVVADLAHQMRNGLWKLNNDSIVFDTDGNLVNGQHRLSAVIKSGAAIELSVLRHVSNDTFDTIDTGKKRGGADILAIEGFKNSSTHAAALRIVYAYYEGSLPNSKKLSNRETREIAPLYPGLVDSVSWAVSVKKQSPLLTGAYWATSHYILSRVSEPEAHQFLTRLATGADLKIGEPAYMLRKRLEENLVKKAKYPRVHLLAYAIKAWNAQRQGKQLGLLRYKWDSDYQEEFPAAI